ncbi:hypothetical protein MRX96_048233 [Rhipicephalus microplus]
MGFLRRVDSDAAGENLLSGLQSEVRVISATRKGRTITLRFEGPVPPDHVTLFREAETSGYHYGFFDDSLFQTSNRGGCEGGDEGGSVLYKGSEGPCCTSQINPSTMQPLPATPCSGYQHSSCACSFVCSSVQPPLHVSMPAAAAPKTQPAEFYFSFFELFRDCPPTLLDFVVVCSAFGYRFDNCRLPHRLLYRDTELFS